MKVVPATEMLGVFRSAQEAAKGRFVPLKMGEWVRIKRHPIYSVITLHVDRVVGGTVLFTPNRIKFGRKNCVGFGSGERNWRNSFLCGVLYLSLFSIRMISLK